MDEVTTEKFLEEVKEFFEGLDMEIKEEVGNG
jgi:hypothetical protein